MYPYTYEDLLMPELTRSNGKKLLTKKLRENKYDYNRIYSKKNKNHMVYR